MKRAFCSATWNVNSSSFESHMGISSVRCRKLSSGLTVVIVTDVIGHLKRRQVYRRRRREESLVN